MDACKLVALDPDDLEVVSAHVQDSAVRVGDILWRPAEKRVVVGLKRVDWNLLQTGEANCRRLVTALRFDRVLSCKAKAINMAAKDGALNLLAVEFTPGTAPAGTVSLIFSAGGMLRLEVECLECELADLGVSAPADDRAASSPQG